MWQEYFRLVKLKPGKVVTALLGEIDFSNDSVPIEKIKLLYENGFPYLEITDEGKAQLYGIHRTYNNNLAKGIPKSGRKNRRSSIYDA